VQKAELEKLVEILQISADAEATENEILTYFMVLCNLQLLHYTRESREDIHQHVESPEEY
jgi:hypothetical protein